MKICNKEVKYNQRSKLFWILSICCLITFALACSSSPNNVKSKLTVNKIPNACIEGGEANLFQINENKAVLSWIEYDGEETNVLKYSIIENNIASPAQIITRGENWFVNWADFPSLIVHPDEKHWVAHYLGKSGEGTYDYDVKLIQSVDAGSTWSEPFTIHTDGVSAEHGFVSILPLENNVSFATWLDGREMVKFDSTKMQRGSMALRAASFDKAGNILEEYLLDDRVCECCQTSATRTPNGLLVAYRDRSETEVRDISIVRMQDKQWSKPIQVSKDNWKVAGCPVNGPVIRSQGEKVALAWYSMYDTIPYVKLAFSDDEGISFGHGIQINEAPALGRIDLEFINDDKVFVSWIEEIEDKAYIMGKIVSTDGEVGQSHKLESISSARSSGFPRICKYKDGLLLNYTKVEPTSKVETRLIEI